MPPILSCSASGPPWIQLVYRGLSPVCKSYTGDCPDILGRCASALAGGANVVVGSSGLSEDDYADLDAAARAAGRGVIAAGNFSVLAATLLHAATLAAEHVSHWEVIDYVPEIAGVLRGLDRLLFAVR